MHHASITRIRASYDTIAPHLDGVVAGFYSRLFAAHPSLRPVFPPDMARQQQHLATSLALVCRNLDRLDLLTEPLMEMGARHARYGVTPDLYPIVRDTLLNTLAEQLGPAWSPQLRQDWSDALNAVAALMLQGAARAASDVAARLAGAAAAQTARR